MKVQQAYPMVAERLTRAGVASPEAEAWQLIEAVTGESRGRLLMEPRNLSLAEHRNLGDWTARRELREPLQLILGRAHFYGLGLGLEPGVLIPRPETERLAELALRMLRGVPSPRVLDVGTGAGALALAIKSERPDARVMASDVSAIALAVSARNAAELGLEIEVEGSDLLAAKPVAGFAAEAHALVSNPPYLPDGDRETAQPEVRWDPEGALYAGADGLAVFRRLLSQAASVCSPGTLLLVELDPRNVEAAANEAAGWSSARVHEDLAGRRRFLELRR
ncbi:MAG: peptide chain release factor N(5)-glutamine methyltransferase [Trueperaceae bacterium]